MTTSIVSFASFIFLKIIRSYSKPILIFDFSFPIFLTSNPLAFERSFLVEFIPRFRRDSFSTKPVFPNNRTNIAEFQENLNVFPVFLSLSFS